MLDPVELVFSQSDQEIEKNWSPLYAPSNDTLRLSRTVEPHQVHRGRVGYPGAGLASIPCHMMNLNLAHHVHPCADPIRGAGCGLSPLNWHLQGRCSNVCRRSIWRRASALHLPKGTLHALQPGSYMCILWGRSAYRN